MTSLLEVVKPSLLESEIKKIPPPVPWSNWDEVKQIREALPEHRFLLLRRPVNLDLEEQEQLEFLLSSPAGTELEVARSFLEDWYFLWIDDEGERRTLADAQARYEAWRTHLAYGAGAQLRLVLNQMIESKFEQLSQFLLNPEWEATNNRAEWTVRAFRHRQSPHFNLRKQESIENAITVVACLRKEAAE